jgi:toxin-antitoxin system PIN domain toxin
VIVLDANLLIYAYDSGSTQHGRARPWIEKIFSGMDTVGVPWQAGSAFLRFMTNRRLPGPKMSLEAASQIVTEWIGQPSIRLLSPGDGHWSILRRMLIEGQAPGALVSDAVIAALTVEHGGTLYSADRDFARFPGLRWVNPLE